MAPNRVVVYIVMIAFVACGCNAAARRERESAVRQKKEAIEELRRIQVAVHGLQILVSVGLTKQEYSQRLEDTLLKAGDIEQSASENIRKFDPKEQRAAQEIYTHLRQSLLAYQHARDYFGDKFNAPGCEDGCWLLSQQDFETEKKDLPRSD